MLALWIQNARILICTPNNSAANFYVEGLDREWKRGNTRGYRYKSIVLGLNTQDIIGLQVCDIGVKVSCVLSCWPCKNITVCVYWVCVICSATQEQGSTVKTILQRK